MPGGDELTEGCSASGRWRLATPLVVRVAGLPVNAVERLRCNESFELASRLAAERERLVYLAEELSEALYDVIGTPAGAEQRPALVGLRRALHQLRRPSGREWAPAVRAVLPVDLRDRITNWLARRARWQEQRGTRLTAVLADEMTSKRAELLRVSGDPGFRHALSLASPSLFDELAKWRAGPNRQPKPQTLVRLAKYVSRAVAKTSPYSTFTVSGFGTWADRPDDTWSGAGWATGCVLELDGRYLQTVSRLLARRPEIAAMASVRLNPSARRTESAIEFIGPPPAESIVTLSRTPALGACLDVLLAGSALTRDRLVTSLADTTTGADPTDVARFVARLIDIGLVEAYLPISDHAADPMGELARWLSSAVGPAVDQLTALVADVGHHLGRPIEIADLDGSRQRHHDLDKAMSRLGDELGVQEFLPDGAAVTHAPHEAAVALDSVVSCGVPAWRPMLADLDVVRRWLAVFDSKLPIQLALGTFVGERFGAGCRIPFAVLHRAVQQELGAATANITPAAADLRVLLNASSMLVAPSLADRALPRLRMLDELRTEARTLAMSSDESIWLDPALVAKQIASWPGWARRQRSSACYVQVEPSSGELRLVLNVMHGGHGRGRSRLRHQIRRAGGTPPELNLPVTGPGVVLAELSGLMGSTLNVRAPSLPYEIDYPCTVSDRPDHERIPLSDLLVCHDPETDLISLYSQRLDATVVPAHLGMFAEFQLPPTARFLERAFAPAYLVHPSTPPLATRPSDGGSDKVTTSPRIEVGQVVVQRARWYVPVRQVPERKAGEPDAAFLIRLVAWLSEHRIPQRCFLRIWGTDLRGAAAKARKPIYLDFANWFLVALFEREVGAAELVVFEEALPALRDAQSPTPGRPTVTEFVVELSDDVDVEAGNG